MDSRELMVLITEASAAFEQTIFSKTQYMTGHVRWEHLSQVATDAPGLLEQNYNSKRITAFCRVTISNVQFHGSVHHISVNENTNLMQQS